MTPSLFPAADPSDLSQAFSLETPPSSEPGQLMQESVPVAAGDTFFLADEEEYFSFEI
jgi:hypothetical protein